MAHVIVDLGDWSHVEVAHLGSGLAYLPTIPSVDGGEVQVQESSKGRHIWLRASGKLPEGEPIEVYVELPLQEAWYLMEQLRYMVEILHGIPVDWQPLP